MPLGCISAGIVALTEWVHEWRAGRAFQDPARTCAHILTVTIVPAKMRAMCAPRRVEIADFHSPWCTLNETLAHEKSEIRFLSFLCKPINTHS